MQRKCFSITYNYLKLREDPESFTKLSDQGREGNLERRGIQLGVRLVEGCRRRALGPPVAVTFSRIHSRTCRPSFFSSPPNSPEHPVAALEYSPRLLNVMRLLLVPRTATTRNATLFELGCSHVFATRSSEKLIPSLIVFCSTISLAYEIQVYRKKDSTQWDFHEAGLLRRGR